MSNRSPPRTWARLLLWPGLILLGCASLYAVGRWVQGVDLQSFDPDRLRWGPLALAVGMQLIIQGVTIFAWHRNLQLHGMSQLSLQQSTVMMGINAIGKYSPGKVWGMIARGAILHRMNGGRETVVLSALVEQLAMVHSGVWLASLLYFWRQGMTVVTVGVLVVGVVSALGMRYAGDVVLGWLVRLPIKRWQGLALDVSGFSASYLTVFLWLSLVWLLSGLMMLCCLAAYQHDGTFSYLDATFSAVLGYVAGFMAFFSLAGLGVREGVLAATLAAQTGLAVALYIAFLHRLVTLVVDMALGAYAYVVSPDLFRQPGARDER